MRISRFQLISFVLFMTAFLMGAPVHANPVLVPLPAPPIDPKMPEMFDLRSLPLVGEGPFIEEPILESEISEKLNQIETLRYLSRCA